MEVARNALCGLSYYIDTTCVTDRCVSHPRLEVPYGLLYRLGVNPDEPHIPTVTQRRDFSLHAEEVMNLFVEFGEVKHAHHTGISRIVSSRSHAIASSVKRLDLQNSAPSCSCLKSCFMLTCFDFHHKHTVYSCLTPTVSYTIQHLLGVNSSEPPTSPVFDKQVFQQAPDYDVEFCVHQ